MVTPKRADRGASPIARIARGLLGMAWERIECGRRGHDPVLCGSTTLCRRCLRPVR